MPSLGPSSLIERQVSDNSDNDNDNDNDDDGMLKMGYVSDNVTVGINHLITTLTILIMWRYRYRLYRTDQHLQGPITTGTVTDSG